MDPDVQRELSCSKMRLRAKSPYFAVLASYLRPTQVPKQSVITTAAVDGVRLYICREFWMALSSEERDFVLAHEVMHCALGHVSPARVGSRHRLLWNVACDFVINLILRNAKFRVPQKCLIDDQFDKMTAEEVYEMLLKSAKEMPQDGMLGGDVQPTEGAKDGEVQKVWKSAKASAAAASKMMGNDPLGDQLRVHVEESTTDWRKILWQELALSVSDFEEWDRRFVCDEMFCESIELKEEYTLRAAVCVDTSGSMLECLGRVIGEIRQIMQLYKQLEIYLYFEDAQLVGPVKMEDYDKPVGGGGTSFVPFFEECERKRYDKAIYFTDLYGQFPSFVPKAKTMWIVPPGGSTEPVPFGEVVRMVS